MPETHSYASQMFLLFLFQILFYLNVQQNFRRCLLPVMFGINILKLQPSFKKSIKKGLVK